MIRILAAAVLVASLLAAPAAASDKKKDAAPNPTVLMSPIAVPVIINGKLVNYIYVTLRLNLSSTADSGKMRDKQPFFRDAVIRAAHRTLLVQPDNPNKLDEARFRAMVVRETSAVAGKGMVTGLQILKEMPQRNVSKSQMAPPRPTSRPSP